MEERDLIPEIDPTLGLTDEQVQSRTPAGKPVYSGKSEKEIVLTHCFTFFNLIFVILAVMLVIGGSSPLNMGFLVVAVINTVIGIIQEIRAKRAVERLTLVAERPVAVIRSGARQEISPEAIVKDDIAEFASGDTLPADGILRSGEMWVDESLLTGEADAVTKTPGDEVKSGSAILSGRGRVQFTAVGGDSFAAQLSREAQKNPSAKKSEMMRSLDRLILFVGIALVPVGIILFYQEFCVLKLGLESSVEGTVAALVGMIPEGLYLLTSIAMAASAVKLSRKKVLVQDMNCIETLARVDVLCVDKTGTITEPDMEVENVVPLVGRRTRNIWKPSSPPCTARQSRTTPRARPFTSCSAAKPTGSAKSASPSPRRPSGAGRCSRGRARFWWARRNSFWRSGTRNTGTPWTAGRSRAAACCWPPGMTATPSPAGWTRRW